jgi:DNA-binding PadR family transcriptional regulator
VAGRPYLSTQARTVIAALHGHPAHWRYGYDIARETGLASGTLYPILCRLADRGLLETQWEDDPPSGRPRRHLYRLSATGSATAIDLRSASAATPKNRRRRLIEETG